MTRKILESLTEFEIKLLRMIIYNYEMEGIKNLDFNKKFKMNEEVLSKIVKYYENAQKVKWSSSYERLLELAYKLRGAIQKEKIIDVIENNTDQTDTEVKEFIESKLSVKKNDKEVVEQKKEETKKEFNQNDKIAWFKKANELCSIIQNEFEKNIEENKKNFGEEIDFIKFHYDKYIFPKKDNYSFKKFYGSYRTNKSEWENKKSLFNVKKK